MDTILTPEDIDRYTGQGYWQDRMITDFLDDAAAAPRTSWRRSTPAGPDLRRPQAAADRAALGLLELGIGPVTSSRSRSRTGSSS